MRFYEIANVDMEEDLATALDAKKRQLDNQKKIIDNRRKALAIQKTQKDNRDTVANMAKRNRES